MFVLVLGGVLSGAALVWTADASRSAYHVYAMKKQLERGGEVKVQYVRSRRGFTHRYGAFNRKKNIHRLNSPVPRARSHRYRPVRLESRKRMSQAFRAHSVRKNNQASWRDRVHYSGSVKTNTGGDVRLMETYENDRFSIHVPNNWHPTPENTHLFTNSRSDFTISVHRIENGCQGVSFTMCAIALSKNENMRQKFFLTGKTTRLTREAQTVLNSEIKTSTFSEHFIATQTGLESIFVNRYYVADLEGGIFVIETKGDARTASDFIETSKAVFDSFRVF